MKKYCCLLALFLFTTAHSQRIVIVPAPVSLVQKTGNYKIDPATRLVLADKGLERSARFFNSYLKKFYGFVLPVTTSSNRNSAHAVILAVNKLFVASPGSYQLSVNDKAVIIGGGDEAGVFYGIQSLIQLLPLEKTRQLIFPQVEITDHPRFAYRGMHLDVARHFLPLDFVKKYIDFIAMHKMNTFHWHLTDDQGWRIEIKEYPKLTRAGAFRNGTIIGHHPGTGNDGKREGGFYTQEEIKEVVKYAADRYITVIPEIEMPGHASAAIAAYPQLSCFPDEPTPHAGKVVWNGPSAGKQVQQSWGVYEDVFAPTEYTFHFLEGVLDEVMRLFPSTYIHIGGDECPKEFWKRSTFCQQLIKEKDLKDEHGLQSYFIQRIEKYLNAKGRRIIGWDEILEGGLAPNATVMSWRGEKGGVEAAQQKHKVIMTPGAWVYFDHSQLKKDDSLTIGGYLNLKTVYNYEPMPAELSGGDTSYILGAQANMWTEYMSNPAKVEYMLFPRLDALSEVLWSPKQQRSWQVFESKLPELWKRYAWMGLTFSKRYEQ